MFAPSNAGSRAHLSSAVHQPNSLDGEIYAPDTPVILTGGTKQGVSMAMQNAAFLNLDHTHCRAICDEIGGRLHFIMKPASDIPPRLLDLIGRLAELEKAELPQLELAPSIVPSIDEMSDATGDAVVSAD